MKIKIFTILIWNEKCNCLTIIMIERAKSNYITICKYTDAIIDHSEETSIPE